MWEELTSADVLTVMDRDSLERAASRAPLAVVPPCARAEIVRLADGTPLRVQPLRRGDRSTVKRLFARLGPESRLRRFLSPVSTLGERELAFLADVGHAGHEAVTAVDARDGTVAGIARYVQHRRRPEAADVAVAVADDLHRRGIGSVLMNRVIACAHANGFHLLTATTLWENRPARALLKSAGFTATSSAGAEIELELELIGASPPPTAA